MLVKKLDNFASQKDVDWFLKNFVAGTNSRLRTPD
jgi:hypothetical protein